MSLQVNLQIRVGEDQLYAAFEVSGVAALVGPNGAGKTTLLRALVGAHRPLDGVLSLGGRRLFDARQKIDVSPESRRIGYVPQGRSLFPHLDVLDNVAFGLSRRLDRSERREKARGLLDEMGCAALAARPSAGLSGGEAQRVVLARALIVDPALLLLDEPLSALDAGARRGLRSFLGEVCSRRGHPVLMVTHDPRDIGALGAEVVAIESGSVAQLGALAEVARRPATPFLEELFEGYVVPDGSG